MTNSASANGAASLWATYELTLKGPSAGNPFQDVDLRATFSQGDRLVRVQPRWGVENWNWIEVAEGLAAGDRLAAQPGQIVGEGPFSAATEQMDE